MYAELYEFDILAFIETWLNPAVDPTDLLLDSYCEPERKDRPGDSHGGIMIYIKDLKEFTTNAVKISNHEMSSAFGLNWLTAMVIIWSFLSASQF